MTTLSPGVLWRLEPETDAESWAYFLSVDNDVSAQPDGIYVSVPEGGSVDVTDPTVRISAAEGEVLRRGFYWLDMAAADYDPPGVPPHLNAFAWIRELGAQPVKTSETRGRVWVLLELPQDTFVSRNLLRLTGPWSPAPKGRETTPQDTIYADVPPGPVEQLESAAESAHTFALWGGLTLAGIGLFTLLKGKR